MLKLDLEKAEEPEIKLPTPVGSQKKQESSRKNIYFCFIDYGKALDCVDHHKLWKILRNGHTRSPYLPHEKPVYAGQEATVKIKHGTTNWFKIGKGVSQGCLLSLYLFNLDLILSFIQPCEMPGWMKLKIKSRLPGEISITSDMHTIPPLWQKVKN